MTDAEENTNLEELLAAQRATPAILLRQLATHTQADAPPAQLNAIAEARAAIARLKAALRARGVAVTDQPADAALPTPPAHDPAPPPRTRVDVQLNASMIAAGGTATGLDIQHLSGEQIHFHHTATSLNNLMALLRSQGDYEGAKPLYKRALAICEQVLGPSHPHTTRSLNNLAQLLRSQGDYAGAKPLYERALAICELRLGKDHPTTQTIRTNLAALDASPQSSDQQIAGITAHFEAAVAQALADPGSNRAALAEQLEARARWAEDGKAEESPYLALAAHL